MRAYEECVSDAILQHNQLAEDSDRYVYNTYNNNTWNNNIITYTKPTTTYIIQHNQLREDL